MSRSLLLPVLHIFAALVLCLSTLTDEAPRTAFTGTLNYAASKKIYSLNVPVYSQVGDSKILVAAYDLPLTLPEGMDLEAVTPLVGAPVVATGYVYGEPRQLLAIELTRATTDTTASARSRPRAEKKGKSDDYLPKEVKEVEDKKSEERKEEKK